MKTATKLIVVFLLVMVWCGATLYATNTMEILPYGNVIERYMVLCPFIVLVGILVIMVIESKDKTTNA